MRSLSSQHDYGVIKSTLFCDKSSENLLRFGSKMKPAALLFTIFLSSLSSTLAMDLPTFQDVVEASQIIKDVAHILQL